MKLIKKIVAGVCLLAVVQSCKKGENDPFLSLRSRKARLIGEWELVSIKGENNLTEFDEVTQDSIISYLTTDYTNGVLTNTTTTDGITSTKILDYSSTFIVDKNGTCTLTKMYDSIIQENVYNWGFANKDKKQDLKKKESLVLSTQKYTETNPLTLESASETYMGGENNLISWTIDRLTNKELVIISEYDVSMVNPFGYVSKNKISYTYKKKR